MKKRGSLSRYTDEQQLQTVIEYLTGYMEVAPARLAIAWRCPNRQYGYGYASGERQRNSQ